MAFCKSLLKFFLLVGFVWISVDKSNAQAPYGFEWIDFQQPHYKISTLQKRLYRISYSQLSISAPDIANAPTSQICIFNNGKKIPIFISWEGTTPQSSDFIEFLGTPKTGEIDAKLYRDSSWILNPYASNFYDTNHYYLTLRPTDNLHLSSQTVDTTAANSTADFLIATARVDFRNAYETGRRSYYNAAQFVYSPEYDAGEGFGLNIASNQNVAIPTPGFINSSTYTPSLRMRIFARSHTNHRLQIRVGGVGIKDTAFFGSTSIDFLENFDASRLAASTNISVFQQVGTIHGYSLGFGEIKYARNFNFSSLGVYDFELMPSSEIRKFRLLSYPHGNSPVVLINYTSMARYLLEPSNSMAAISPANTTNQKFQIINQANITYVSELKKINYSNLLSRNGNFIIISDSSLRLDSFGNDILESYRAYKSTPQAGSYLPTVAFMEELQEFFGYGYSRHPLAIRKFLQWAKNTWPNIDNGHVLLIGKGLPITGVRGYNAANNAIHKIPPFGHAMSDILYPTMDTSIQPFFHIGRLAVTNANQIAIYLDKLKAYDESYSQVGGIHQTPQKKEYLKRMVHLAGGFSAEQKNMYKDNVIEFESIAKKPKIGANILSIIKADRDQIPTESSVDLEKFVDDGVSLITFFGHSSASVLDVGIRGVSNFNNKGKYPIFLANGCSAGNIFNSVISQSEEFLYTPERGALGFLASSNTALDAGLYVYSKNFYNLISGSQYGATIGKTATNSSMLSIGEVLGKLNYVYTTALEFVYHGDPSVRLPFYQKPDFYIDASYVTMQPQVANLDLDSIRFRIIISNLGQAIDQNIKLKITRIAENARKEYDFSIKAPYFKDTFYVAIKNIENELKNGTHRIGIKIDADNQIDELSEMNNELNSALNLIILEEDAIPILPEDLSIVGTDTIELHAMSYKKSTTALRYFFQIDTSKNFNSPLFTQNQIETKNQHIRWMPNIKWIDSTVYYWRVATDPAFTQKPIHWNNMSFLLIKKYSKGGWNQSHYFQNKQSSFKNIVQDSISRIFKFNNKLRNYELIFNGQRTTSGCRWYENDIRMFEYVERDIMSSGIFATVIHNKDGSVWTTKDTMIGTARWGTDGTFPLKEGIIRYGHIFQDTGLTPASHQFPSTPWHQVFLNFIQRVQPGDYVMISSLQRPKFTNWHPDLISFFRQIGFSQIDSLKAGTVDAPFGLVYKKDDNSFPLQSKIGINFTDFVSLKFQLSGNWFDGEILSPRIGKSRNWDRLQYELQTSDNPSFDNNKIELIGYDASNNAQLLKSFNSQSIDTSISYLSPNTYPFLQLRLRTSDSVAQTPTQLKYWRVLYQSDIPELLANSDKDFKLLDTIYWGQKQLLEFDIDNISEQYMDSIEVKITLKNSSYQREFFFKVPPILAKQSYRFRAEFLLDQYLEGVNNMLIEINPEGRPFYKSEKYSFNNFIEKQFLVLPDRENPLLQITFDGMRIVHNELVSPTPNVSIKLKDDNPYLLLNDTSIITLWLTTPSGVVERLYFSSPNILFKPAIDGKNNLAEVLWTPQLTDGLYLLTVKDADRSGNSSSSRPSFSYKIGFRVITKMMASRVLNYPNPFSTATQFVFTLTGSKIPDRIQIQILNIRGQVVKIIQKEELGPLRIGLNRTQYAWDGTDMYGDRLANGVYLYKVDIMENGKAVEQIDRENFRSISGSSKDLEQFFNKEYGKMVILR